MAAASSLRGGGARIGAEATGETVSRGGRGKSRLAASHQRSWLWGRYAVQETLQAGRWPVLELLLADELDPAAAQEVRQRAAQLGLTVQTVSAARLTQLCGSTEHQGCLARMAEFPCGNLADWQRLLESRLPSSTAAPPALFVICDHIQDAHNFGAILRCCDGAGATAVLVEARQQAAVTPHVARASAGAVNHLQLYRVDDLLPAVQLLQQAGVLLVAASEKSDCGLWDADLHAATALIVGSEASGIRPELLALCDLQLSIPMAGRVSSLNAAVAAGILMYEIRRQQGLST